MLGGVRKPVAMALFCFLTSAHFFSIFFFSWIFSEANLPFFVSQDVPSRIYETFLHTQECHQHWTLKINKDEAYVEVQSDYN